MRHRWVAIVFSVMPMCAVAQPARTGRLPVLELPAVGGGCRTVPLSAELRGRGFARAVDFTSSDSSGHRLISLALDASGRPVFLQAMMGTEQGRRGESESVDAFFNGAGQVSRGHRRAFTTGTPARLSDDREVGLLAADTEAVNRLVTSIRQRCHM